jgi:O-antigen ligase
MKEFRAQPILGQGLATRLTDRTRRTAQILDDQWLKSLLETGLLGVAAWAWLFLRYVRRLGRAAKDDRFDQSWLAVALTAGIVAFAAGMFLYDTFSFIQTTFVAFLLIALGPAVLSIDADRRAATAA